MKRRLGRRVHGGETTGNEKPPTFEGSQLVFCADRVELCGVKVCGRTSRIRTILEALRE